ncbi:MAG: alpha/beta hydrolase, partial [Gibbsiella quercinecans]|uniref:alpha/beta fold hydrolase n=1 Tax=Gibbsiella quercinecans TaxID=929813 RepID=UPI003F2E75D0
MLPFVFIPGLLGSPRLYQEQTHVLWQHAPVMIANSSQDDALPAIARRILAAAPARFILLGLSMGGYVAFEILRQAPERVQRLILLDTSARPDTPEARQSREQQIQAASEGAFLTLIEDAYRFCVHPSR